MKEWIIVENVKIEDLPGKYFGFIYKITNLANNKIYIGRKNFYTRRKRRFGKKEIAKMKDKRSKKYEWVVKESNWKTYNSSSKELKEDIKNGDEIKREILFLVEKENQMVYFETKFQFIYSVLEEGSYNRNILGRFYRTIFE